MDNNDGVITHLEPDILECEVKWALGSITMNKASGGDEIPDELFSYLKKTMLLQCCAQSLSHVPLLVAPWTRGSPAGSSIRIFQARMLEWVAISFSRGSSQPRN